MTEINAIAPHEAKFDVALPRKPSLPDGPQPNMMRQIRAQSREKDTREDFEMIERVLSLQHSSLALFKKSGARDDQVTGIAAFKDAILRLLRKIGEFFAAGGPLS